MDSEGVFVFWTGYSISAEIICAGDGDIWSIVKSR